MSNFIEYVTEIMVVKDALNVARDVKLSDRVRVKDKLVSTVGVLLADSLHVADRLTGGVTAKTVERARIKDLTSAYFHQNGQLVEKVRVRDAVRGVLGAKIAEVAHVSDQLRGGVGVRIKESAKVAARLGQVGIGTTTKEKVRVKDRASGAVLAQLSDRTVVADAIAGQVLAKVSERITARDTTGSAKLARSVDRLRVIDSVAGVRSGAATTERVRVKDRPAGFVRARVQDSVAVHDILAGQAKVLARTADQIKVADQVAGAGSVTGRITERMRASDLLSAQYHASAMVMESVYVADQLPGAGKHGFAWTAPAEGWSMSRYDNYPIESVLCVDGVAYGCGPDGVYALKGGQEIIEARLTTGRMDVGQGMLAHPTYAFMEYELDGEAVMGVKQTQGGEDGEVWEYPLEPEAAEVLTNGRFKFGRGLRGRHFAFDLSLTGAHAHIDDLYVVADVTKRRV